MSPRSSGRANAKKKSPAVVARRAVRGQRSAAVSSTDRTRPERWHTDPVFPVSTIV
jgi:hypothetical protein